MHIGIERWRPHMDSNASDPARRVLCRADELRDGESREFHATPEDEYSLFVVRRRDRIYAYRNSCPHTGAPLNWQGDRFLSFDGSLIQCSLHGAQFRIEDGICIWGPCVRQRLTPLRAMIEQDLVVLLPEDKR